MKKNLKRLIVILGIVVGFSCMGMEIMLGQVSDWIPVELEYVYQEACEKIAHTHYVAVEWDTTTVGDVVRGVCLCDKGFKIGNNNDCVELLP